MFISLFSAKKQIVAITSLIHLWGTNVSVLTKLDLFAFLIESSLFCYEH